MGQIEELFGQGKTAYAEYQRSRSAARLDAAITAFNRAVNGPWGDTKDQVTCIFSLVQALSDGAMSGSDRYTNMLIEVTGNALKMQAENPYMLNMRGYGEMLRYKRLGSPDDLNAAVTDFKTSFAKSAVDDAAKYMRGMNLAWASESRFDRLQARGEEYMVIQLDGVEKWRGPRDLVLPIYVLESLLQADIQSTQSTTQDAVSGVGPPCPPNKRPLIKRNLSNLYRKYADHVTVRSDADRRADMERAVQLTQEAFEEMEPGPDRTIIAQSLLDLLADDQAIGLLPPALVDPALLRQVQEVAAASPVEEVTERALVARDRFNGAVRLARTGRPDEAVAIWKELVTPGLGISVPPDISLESLKALLWPAFAASNWPEVAELERTAQPLLDTLSSRRPQFFTRDGASVDRGRLANLAAYALARVGDPAGAVEVLEKRRATMLTQRLRLKVDRPAGPPSSAAGVVAHLVTTSAGGVALISGSGATRAVRLDDLGRPGSAEMTAYAQALDAVRDNVVIGFKSWVKAVGSMVDYLSDALRPLSDAVPDGRVTLVPCGSLALLPVGAALLQSGTEARSVSLVPSLGAARKVAPGEGSRAVTVVAEPALSSSRVEASGVAALFPSAVTPLPGVTPERLMAVLPPGGVLHLACHASCDVGQPLNCAILLPGGARWTVEGILDADLSKVALTVLSACESGLTGPYLADEALDVRSAFLGAGCPAVVSTLWMVEDRSSALIMLRFYWEWRHLGADVPHALARAQRWQRDTTDADKCHFLQTELVAAGVLTQADGSELAERIRTRSQGPDSNSFAAPYFWAGFCVSGA